MAKLLVTGVGMQECNMVANAKPISGLLTGPQIHFKRDLVLLWGEKIDK